MRMSTVTPGASLPLSDKWATPIYFNNTLTAKAFQAPWLMQVLRLLQAFGWTHAKALLVILSLLLFDLGLHGSNNPNHLIGHCICITLMLANSYFAYRKVKQMAQIKGFAGGLMRLNEWWFNGLLGLCFVLWMLFLI